MTKSVFTEGYNSLLDLLIETRKKRGIRQSDLADKLGRPQPFISYVERGERRLDVLEFVAIAQALDSDPIELFTELCSRLPNNVDI